MARTSSFLGATWQTNPARLPRLLANGGTTFFSSQDFSAAPTYQCTDGVEQTVMNVSGGGGWLTHIITPECDATHTGGNIVVDIVPDGVEVVDTVAIASGKNNNYRLIYGGFHNRSGSLASVSATAEQGTIVGDVELVFPYIAVSTQPLSVLRFESSCIVRVTHFDVETTTAYNDYAGCCYVLDADLS